MNISERINLDLKSAQKSGEGEKVSLLRLLVSELHNKEIERRSAGKESSLSDEDEIEVIRKEAKKRKEAVGLFRAGGRADLAEKEEKELLLIQNYLPAEMGRDEIANVIKELKSGGLNDFNSLIREAMKRLKGSADGKLVSKTIKEVLSGNGG